MKNKIGIIGAGNVGATIAHLCLMKDLGDIYLLDINRDMAEGKAIDLNQSKYLFNSDAEIIGGDDYDKLFACDYVVITAGFPRKPGMSRDDLLFKNFEIIKDISLKIKESKKAPMIIVVTNPLDIMTYAVYKITGMARTRVLGMAGVLDTYRFYHYVQNVLNTSSKNIYSVMLGSHGDTMVPVISKTYVNGKKISASLAETNINELAEKARNGGATIVSLLKTGSAYYAPAASTVKMLDCIINNTGTILPCSICAKGEYGINDICIGLPVLLNIRGASKIMELALEPGEKDALLKSAAAIKEQVDKITPLIS